MMEKKIDFAERKSPAKILCLLLLVAGCLSEDSLFGREEGEAPPEENPPMITPLTRTALGYKWSLGRDFSQDRLLARFLEANLCLCARFNDFPAEVGYFFRLPVADAGTRDFGLKKAIRYDHSVGMQTFFPGKGSLTPFLHLSYIFYGFTGMEARTPLTGTTLSGDVITTPESDVHAQLSTRGYSYGLGLEWTLYPGKNVYASFMRSLAKIRLERLDINGLDQKYLGSDTIDGATENSNALLFGAIWEIF